MVCAQAKVGILIDGLSVCTGQNEDFPLRHVARTGQNGLFLLWPGGLVRLNWGFPSSAWWPCQAKLEFFLFGLVALSG